jgi:hypothetical protein
MAFPVTALVPLAYQWVHIDESLSVALSQHGIKKAPQLSDHYAWLLQITSWSLGFDWNPKENTVTLEVPFSGPLAGLDTSYDKADYDQDIAKDEIAILLQKCMEKVTLKRLLAHFQTAD